MALLNYLPPDYYKRVSDLDPVSEITGDELLLISKKNGVGYRSSATNSDAISKYCYETYTKPDIDYLDEIKSDKSHKHILKDITDISAVYRQVAEWIDPEELAQAIADLNLSQYETKNDARLSIATVEEELDKIEAEILNIKNDYALTSELPTKVSQLENDSGYLVEDDLIPYTYQNTSHNEITASNTEFILDVETPVAFFDISNSEIIVQKFLANTNINDGTYTWEVIFEGGPIQQIIFNVDNITYVGKENILDNTFHFDSSTSRHAFSVRLFKADGNMTWLFNHTYDF